MMEAITIRCSAMNAGESKRCTRCGQLKTTTEFHRARREADGRRSWCKACAAAYYREHKEEIVAKKVAYCRKHKAKIAARMAAYRRKHKEEIATSDAAYRRGRKEEYAAYYAAYYRTNKERIAARNAAYYHTNKERIVARDAAYRRGHKEERAAGNAAYRRTHKEEIAASKARRRARKKGAFIGPRFTRACIYERDGGRCHVCGKRVAKKAWHLDHIVPLSRGGEHSRRNVAVSCAACNMRKNAKSGYQMRLFG